jgi:hypothetical protein
VLLDRLDGCVNFIYRAAKNRRDARPDLAQLEEIEAAPWFLWTLFALYGRVRPYNKYLGWELDTHPLPAPWIADHLVKTLTDRPSRLFPELERVARAKGFGDVLDAWDGLDLVRRPDAFRPEGEHPVIVDTERTGHPGARRSVPRRDPPVG